MVAILQLLGAFVANLFTSRRRLASLVKTGLRTRDCLSTRLQPTDRRRKLFASLTDEPAPAANFKPLVFDEFQTGVDIHSPSRRRAHRYWLKSYDQGRESFQGTEQHVIWLDEE